MKVLVGAFNQEKALVGAFSVIVQPVVEPMNRFAALGETHSALLRQPPLRTRGSLLHRPEVRAAGAVHADGEAGADLQDGVRGGRRGRLPHQIRHRAGQADQD